MTHEEINCYIDSAKIRLNDGDLDGSILLLKTAQGAIRIYKRKLAEQEFCSNCFEGP